MGRPSKYTQEVVSKILGALQLGCSRKHAAAIAGVNRDTLAEWQKQYEEFGEQIAEAEARGVVTLLGRIRQASVEDWRAAAWLLERRFPAEYGRQALDVHLDGETDNQIRIEIRRFDAYAALHEIIDDDAGQATPAIPALIVEADPEPAPVRTLPIEPVQVDPPPLPRHQVEPEPRTPEPPTKPMVQPASEPEPAANTSSVGSVAEMIARSIADERTRRRNNLDF